MSRVSSSENCNFKHVSFSIRKNKKKIIRTIKIHKKCENFTKSNGKITISIKNTKNNLEISVEEETFNHLDSFFRLCEYKKINIPCGLFGNSNPSKEMTETYSAIRHIRDFLIDNNLENLSESNKVLCICVADGKRPQTGYIFASATNWITYSIDPMMIENFVQKTNLVSICSRIEDVDLENISNGFEYVVIVGVHSHADFNNLWNRFENKKLLGLSIPCCDHVVHKLNKIEPYFEKSDAGILSRKNTVVLYQQNFTNGKM